jgi:hypothetical protein
MTEKAGKPFNGRAFISVLTGFSFLLMAVTGLVLFFAPSCRMARDTSWTVWGQSKEQWVAVHVWLSIVFLIASLFHLYLNWTPLVNYFRSRIRKSFGFRIEWIAALVICGIIYAGTICNAMPFSSLIAWKDTFKHGTSEAGMHGRGWRGGRMAAQQSQNPLSTDGSSLSGHTCGLECEGNQNDTCNKTHEHTNTADNRNVENCEHQQAGVHEGAQALEPHRGRGGSGMGQKTLKQFCNEEGIELSSAITLLKNNAFTARETMTMREIADNKRVHPRELRNILQPEH